MADRVPATIGKYRIERELGRGASGVVYLGLDGLRGRKVAVKQMHAHLLAEPAQAARHRRQLQSEAALAARLRHPNIVRLLDADESATPPYLVFEYLSGRPLSDHASADTLLPVAQVLDIAFKCGHALEYAERQGLVHRDIKPANLHLGDDGVLRVLDLGVALSGREPAAMRALHAGTPSYVNPEQWGFRSKGAPAKGEAAEGDGAGEQLPTAQSDLFALGVTLYQLLTGRLPYGDVLPYQVGRYHRDPTPPSRHNPEVPIWLNHVVLKAVALDQRQRFETAEEFLLALERGASRPLQALHGTPLMQRDPTAVWKLATGVLALINLLLVYWLLFLPK